MTSTPSDALPTTAPSPRQRMFVRYLTAILVDLTILNLFEEYWSYVEIDSFTMSLIAAILLQILLKLTIVLEHRVATYWNARPGGFAKFMRFFCAWLVLFGSKFVILEVLDFALGDHVDFYGPFDGLLALIVIIFVMIGAEEGLVRLVRRLA